MQMWYSATRTNLVFVNQLFCLVQCKGGSRGERSLPKNYESNFFHHDFE